LSEIRATTISDAAGTGPITLTKQSAAKAFCSIDGSSGTPIEGNSFNISGLVDDGVGLYDVSFTSGFDDLPTLGGMSQYLSSGATFTLSFTDTGKTTSSVRVYNQVYSGAGTDTKADFIAHGDLA
jgi:hypothetical protein